MPKTYGAAAVALGGRSTPRDAFLDAQLAGATARAGEAADALSIACGTAPDPETLDRAASEMLMAAAELRIALCAKATRTDS